MISFRESAGNVLKCGVKYRGVRGPRAYCPALFYCHNPQQTAVYTLKLTYLLIMITIGMFSSLQIWPRKGFHIKTAGQFVLTFGLRWRIRYIPQFMTLPHYNDVIMSAMASQITSPTIVYSTVYSRRRSKKTSKLRVTALCEGNSPVTGELPEEMANNAENVTIWWRHHQHSYVWNAYLEDGHLWSKDSSHYFIHWKHVRK